MAVKFSPGAAGLAALMLTAQTLEKLKAKGVFTQEDVAAVLNATLADFQKSATPESIEAGTLLLQFYNAVPDVSLLTPQTTPAH